MFVAVRLQSHEFNSKNVECFNRNAVSEEIVVKAVAMPKKTVMSKEVVQRILRKVPY